MTSAELTCLKPPAPPSDRGICDFGRGAGGLGPFLPRHCPCAKCSERRTSHGNNQISPSLQNIPKLRQEGLWEMWRNPCWGDAEGLKRRLDANHCLSPSIHPPNLALSSALQVTTSFGFLSFILQFLNNSRFQGPHLFGT